MFDPKNEVITFMSEDILAHLSVYRDDIRQEIAALVYFQTCIRTKKLIKADKEVKENGPIRLISTDNKKTNG
jgi:hypothetical protein